MGLPVVVVNIVVELDIVCIEDGCKCIEVACGAYSPVNVVFILESFVPQCSIVCDSHVLYSSRNGTCCRWFLL